jgi:hypothetical protein
MAITSGDAEKKKSDKLQILTQEFQFLIKWNIVLKLQEGEISIYEV